MKIFLHIGDARTGTTTLQSLFTANRERLKDFNIDYPKAGASTEGTGQHLLAFSTMDEWPQFAIRSKIPREVVWARLRDHMEKNADPKHSLLLSSEGFSSVRSKGLEYIKDFFEGHQVVPIFFHRDPEDWRRSMREQRIKRGYHVPAPKHPAKDLGREKLDRWRQFFDVKVFQYSKTCHAEFFDFIDVPLDQLVSVPRENTQLPSSTIDLLNELNQLKLIEANRVRFNQTIIDWAQKLTERN